jgi:putative endonuclease
MSGNRVFYVYILASLSGTLYIGITSSLERRVLQHKEHFFEGFTSKYGVDRLVYYEAFGDPRDAINREKQLKRWKRDKKIGLFEQVNPHWRDLSREWYEDVNRRFSAWEEQRKTFVRK